MPHYQYSSSYRSFSKSCSSLLQSAATPYHSADWYALWFARIKLRIDPAFSTILQRGLIPDGSRLLDLGCGQGLLASSLLAAQELAAKGCWPEQWPPPPSLVSLKGIDSVPLDIQRAQQALGKQVDFKVADICTADFGQADAIVILDVLHYIDYQAQEDVLRRVKAALSPNGRLILRVGNAAGGIWFKASYWYDRLVWFARVRKDNPLYCRTLDDWLAALAAIGLHAEPVELNRGVSLSNTLLVATNLDS
ncbi:MAG TPA: class I SAM-dependent methyltransferase [Methylophilaceae bacterium]|nr:class I SAM-dependent methyltransferase [Methylophilaceae bacterium]